MKSLFNINDHKLLFLSPKTKLIGSVKSSHSIYIAGEIKGAVNSEKDIYILKGAKLRSNVACENIQIFGLVEGNVTAKGTVIMNEEARVFGNIKCQSLKLLEGAIYSGSLEILS